MCSGSIEQHDLVQLQKELEQEETTQEYMKNYKISFSTFSLLIPVSND
jgi:hypothetical protein